MMYLNEKGDFYDDGKNYIFDKFDKYKGISISGLEIISDAKELLKKEKEEVKRHQSLLDLTTHNLVSTIKRNVYYGWVNENILENAQKWLMIKKSCDKRRKYDEKISYDWLSEEISKALEINDVKIINIMTCGMETYAYEIEFITNDFDYIFQLEIPVIKNMTVDNIEYTYGGNLLFGYKEGESSWKMLWHSYNIMDFKNAIHEIITSEKYLKHISGAGLV